MFGLMWKYLISASTFSVYIHILWREIFNVSTSGILTKIVLIAFIVWYMAFMNCLCIQSEFVSPMTGGRNLLPFHPLSRTLAVAPAVLTKAMEMISLLLLIMLGLSFFSCFHSLLYSLARQLLFKLIQQYSFWKIVVCCVVIVVIVW